MRKKLTYWLICCWYIEMQLIFKLIFHAETLSNSFILHFFCQILRIFSIWGPVICKQSYFYLFFSNTDVFYDFACLIVLNRISNTTELKWWISILVLLQILEKKFSALTIEYVSCVLVIYDFYYVAIYFT
jgi:hypothetical protein